MENEEISRARSGLLVAGAPGTPTPPAHYERRVLCEQPTVLGAGSFDGVGGGWREKEQMRANVSVKEKRSELTRNHAGVWTQLRTPRHGGGLRATSRARLAGACPQPTPFNAHCATGRTKEQMAKKAWREEARVGVLGI